jgi:hypothetical protein
VFDCALPLAKQGGQRALATEAPDDPLSGVRSVFHVKYPNEFFVILQVSKVGAVALVRDNALLVGNM